MLEHPVPSDHFMVTDANNNDGQNNNS
jgi:hypothetical protein